MLTCGWTLGVFLSRVIQTLWGFQGKKKNHREAKTHGNSFLSPSSVREGGMVFSFAQTCKGSFKSMKYLKSKYVGSRYQHTRLVEVSVWDGPGLLLTCDHTHPALICGWVEGGHTSPPGSLGLWLSSIEQVKMFLPFSSSCLTFDRWLKLSELAFSPKIWGGDATYSLGLLDETELVCAKYVLGICCLPLRPLPSQALSLRLICFNSFSFYHNSMK